MIYIPQRIRCAYLAVPLLSNLLLDLGVIYDHDHQWELSGHWQCTQAGAAFCDYNAVFLRLPALPCSTQLEVGY